MSALFLATLLIETQIIMQNQIGLHRKYHYKLFFSNLCACDIMFPLHVVMRERNVVEEFDTDVEILHILITKACSCFLCCRNWASVAKSSKQAVETFGFLHAITFTILACKSQNRNGPFGCYPMSFR